MDLLRFWARLMIRSCPKKEIAEDDPHRRLSKCTARITGALISLSLDMGYFILRDLAPSLRVLWSILFLALTAMLYYVFFKRIAGVARYRRRLRIRNTTRH